MNCFVVYLVFFLGAAAGFTLFALLYTAKNSGADDTDRPRRSRLPK